ncbi:MAG: hypothetical protein HKM93_02870 [Desulfobacteraceae bacterium]|nr:hypothetical protein [Desulfobacteraceae bacterium]
MPIDNGLAPIKKTISTLIILITLIFLSYSNTFQSSWHLDDYINIVERSELHLNTLSLESIKKTFFQKKTTHDRLYRPIPCLSFGLNWYTSQQAVLSYHLVNISIHLLTAFTLFSVIRLLFKTPNLYLKYRSFGYSIALLSSVIWAIHPIQTQAITYIVQRMASMAALFYAVGLFFYLKGKFATVFNKKILFYTCCLLSYMLAIGSKENAIVFPLSLLLVDFVFFRDENLISKKLLYFLIFVLLTISFITIIYFYGVRRTDPITFLTKLYQIRPFSFFERMLTEPRVLIFYLSQIFYPVGSRLSIAHDFELSTSFLSPWTTLISIIIVFSLILFGVLGKKTYPILSFSILFYFLNHTIESSILPLELIFEHRNYLPSFFLFIPISLGLIKLLSRYNRSNKLIMYFLMVFGVVLVFSMGIGTYLRNDVWKDEKSLWNDALMKAPSSARPYIQLAYGHYSKIGDTKKTLELNQKAINLKMHSNTQMLKPWILLEVFITIPENLISLRKRGRMH